MPDMKEPNGAEAGGQQAEKPLMRLIKFGLKHSGAVFLLLSLLGCLGLLALPLFERQVKFDEKTLMLGSAQLNIGCVCALSIALASDLRMLSKPLVLCKCYVSARYDVTSLQCMSRPYICFDWDPLVVDHLLCSAGACCLQHLHLSQFLCIGGLPGQDQ